MLTLGVLSAVLNFVNFVVANAVLLGTFFDIATTLVVVVDAAVFVVAAGFVEVEIELDVIDGKKNWHM